MVIELISSVLSEVAGKYGKAVEDAVRLASGNAGGTAPKYSVRPKVVGGRVALVLEQNE